MGNFRVDESILRAENQTLTALLSSLARSFFLFAFIPCINLLVRSFGPELSRIWTRDFRGSNVTQIEQEEADLMARRVPSSHLASLILFPSLFEKPSRDETFRFPVLCLFGGDGWTGRPSS